MSTPIKRTPVQIRPSATLPSTTEMAPKKSQSKKNPGWTTEEIIFMRICFITFGSIEKRSNAFTSASKLQNAKITFRTPTACYQQSHTSRDTLIDDLSLIKKTCATFASIITNPSSNNSVTTNPPLSESEQTLLQLYRYKYLSGKKLSNDEKSTNKTTKEKFLELLHQIFQIVSQENKEFSARSIDDLKKNSTLFWEPSNNEDLVKKIEPLLEKALTELPQSKKV